MANKTIKKTELVIKALDYAQIHKLDSNDKDDVKKILEVLNPEHTTENEVEEFITLLQSADTFMEMTNNRRESKKTDLPN